MYKEQIFKKLTRNDTGETMSHQSGITIPKNVADSPIFPEMTTTELNPRKDVVFWDEEGNKWTFQYIYYNDMFFGKERSKSHNEHRLTCVKNFLRAYDIKSEDEIWFAIDENKKRHIGYIRNENTDTNSTQSDNITEKNGRIVLKIGTNWKKIKL